MEKQSADAASFNNTHILSLPIHSNCMSQDATQHINEVGCLLSARLPFFYALKHLCCSSSSLRGAFSRALKVGFYFLPLDASQAWPQDTSNYAVALGTVLTNPPPPPDPSDFSLVDNCC